MFKPNRVMLYFIPVGQVIRDKKCLKQNTNIKLQVEINLNNNNKKTQKKIIEHSINRIVDESE